MPFAVRGQVHYVIGIARATRIGRGVGVRRSFWKSLIRAAAWPALLGVPCALAASGSACAQVYQLTVSGQITNGSEYSTLSVPSDNDFEGQNVNNAPFSATETFYFTSPPAGCTQCALGLNNGTSSVSLTIGGSTANFLPGSSTNYEGLYISDYNANSVLPNGVGSTIQFSNSSGLYASLVIESAVTNFIPPTLPVPPTQLGPITVGPTSQGPYTLTPELTLTAANPQVVIDGYITQFSFTQIPIWTNADASICINWSSCNSATTLTGSGNITTGGPLIIGNGGSGGTLGIDGNTLTTGALTIGGTSFGSANVTAGGLSVPAALNASALTVGAAAGGQLTITGTPITTTGSYSYVPASATIQGTITLGSQANAYGTINLYSSTLTSAGVVVGDAGQGSISNNSGNETVTGDLVLANQASASGSYIMGYDAQSGYTTQLTVSGNLVVGSAGSGYFEADYGQATIGGNLSVGGQYSSYYEFGTSAVTVAGSATVGGTGAWVQLGGSSTLTVTGNLTVGGMDSTYLQTGGTVTIGGNATFGGTGDAVYAQLAGNAAFNVVGNLTVGADPNDPTVFITSFNAGDNTTLAVGGNFTVGDTGLVAFGQGAGTTTVGGALTIGNNSGSQGLFVIGGTSTLNAGSLSVGSQAGSYGELDLNIYQGDAATMTVNGNTTIGGSGTGVFNEIGGTATINGNLVVGSATGGTGMLGLGRPASFGLTGYTDGGAPWQNGGPILSTGGGILNVTGNLTVGDAGTGTVTLGGTALLSVGGNLTIGAQQGSTGTFNYNTAAGDGASLIVSGGTVTVGASGSGTFTQDGGILNAKVTLGSNAGGSGTYNLGGGALTATTITVGDAGTGNFIENAGSASVTGNMTVGNQNGSTGTVTLGGTGNLAIAGGLTIGAATGSNGIFNYNLNSSDAATLTVGGSVVVGSSGTGTFTQSGGTFTADMDVGENSGALGTYNLHGNATGIVTGDLRLGVNAGATGNVNVSTNSGDNASLTIDGRLLVGNGGTGNFMQGGGTVSVGGAMSLGALAGSTGTYTISGSASLTANTGLTVGDAGTGIFNQQGGTVIDGGALTVGNANGGNGTYTLGGVASSLTVNGNMTLASQTGSRGTFNYDTANGDTAQLAINGGTLTVGGAGVASFNQSGGVLSLATLNVGSAKGGNGTYTLGGSGTLTIANNLILGNQAGSFGVFAYNVGALNVGGTLTVGNAGYGEFDQNGGALTATVVVGSQSQGIGVYNLLGGSLATVGGLTIGSAAGSAGLFVFGGNASLQLDGTITVGNMGEGSFMQTAGTVVAPIVLGQGGPITGAIQSPGGNGSYQLNGGAIYATSETVGKGGTGTFTQQGGTTNTVSGGLTIASSQGSTGTYQLQAGTLSAATETIGGSGSGTFDQQGGTNTVSGTLAIATKAGSSGTYSVEGGSVTAQTLAVGGTMSAQGGTGTLTVTNGAGVTVLDEIQLWNKGTVDTRAGEIVVGSGTGSVGDLVVAIGGTLKGGGDVFGNVVNAGGKVDLGDPDILSITGNYIQAGGSLVFDVYGNNPGDYDTLTATGNVNITGGTIEVDFLGSTLPPANDVFDFISAASVALSSVDFLVIGLGAGADYTESFTNGIFAFDLVNPGQSTSTTPLPPTSILFATGLLGLGLVRRCKHAARHRHEQTCLRSFAA